MDMIIVIDALNKDRFSDLLDEMFQLRARVFGDRLGWEVKIENGREIDQFDHLDPAYVIGLDDEGHVVSCVRALQTTGPHMLSDVFQVLLDGEPPLRSATIWESTRFCVDTQRLCRDGTMKAVSWATCELMIGSLEYARRSGISDIITVIDPVINRVLKRSDNAPYDYVGSTKQMGKVAAMAALLDCSEERINRVRAFADIHHDVFSEDDDVRALLDRRALAQERLAHEHLADAADDMPVTPADIQDYCRDQIRSAQTPQERKAAQELVDVLVRSRVHPPMRMLVQPE